MKILFFIVAGVLACNSIAQNIFGNSSKAFALMPSEAISSGVVSQVSLSSSGRLIIFQRKIITTVSENPEVAGNWFVHDRKSKTTKRLDIPVDSFVVAMADDTNIVFSSSLPTGKSGILNLKSGTIIPIDLQTGHLIYGGDRDFAPFVMIGNRTGDVTLMSPDGKTMIVNFGENIAVSFPVAGDKENIYFHSMVVHSTPRIPLRLSMSRSTGKVTQRPYRANEERTDLSWDQKTPIFGINAIGEVASIYLIRNLTEEKSEIPGQARIGPGFGKTVLSPKNDYVVYQDAGSLLLREIHPIDLLLAKKLTDADTLAKLIERAKQVGTALAILASDNDDSYPGQEGWETKLQPYVRNREVLKDFNYTFRGGEMGSIQDVSTTELGFFVSNGGRVVVFADTSVRFIPNP